MQIDENKLGYVVRKVGSRVFGSHCEVVVTIGSVDGVTYRVVAMDALTALDMDCADGPDWALCVMPNAK